MSSNLLPNSANVSHPRVLGRGSLESVASHIRQLASRIVRAASLDRPLYLEVMADSRASAQAAFTVIGVAVVANIGLGGQLNLSSLPASIFLSCVGWALWTSIVYFVGRRLLDLEEAGVGWKSLARALGFAHAPGFLRAFGMVPGLGLPVSLVTIAWIFLATDVALRSANDGKSILTVIGVIAVGFVPYISVMVFLNLLVLRSVV